jgi:hypothetical protein
MKKILVILLCVWAYPVVASHIVGGEFEIIHISGNRYRINLILYFDEVNGNEGARDPNVNARIFRKRDNALMMEVFLPFQSQTPVSYTQPACSHGEIVTSKIIYTNVVTLSPQQYNDVQGYYLAWERCCRNYSITNIYSDDPIVGTRYAGQTFYLEFPPVVKNGQPFINSSPRLFPPLNDYACPRRPYYTDFAGVDDDGDSLVYSLVTPLNTRTADALPLPDLRPRPWPYPLVTYRPPFGPDNIIGGLPDLKISHDGFLTVTPSFNGLYVFAVKCEEYRNGEKIGEVRRDFQMLVVDGCNPADPPQILGKKLTDASFNHDNNMTVTFSNDVADEDRCIQVQVSDPDAMREVDGFSENVTIRAIPLGFKKDVSGILPEVTSAILVNGSTQTFDICFDRCPYIEDGPFQIGIVAYDDACSLPLSDTLKVTVNIQPPENKNAYFTSPNVTEVLMEGDSRKWVITASDDDGDDLTYGVITDGFDLKDAGMRIDVVKSEGGLFQAEFVWDAFCDIYDFTGRTNFKVKITVDDADDCNYTHPDTREFNLTVLLPGNSPPVISTDLSDDQVEHGVPLKIFESLSFKVFGDDAVDNDNLRLVSQGTTANMVFGVATGQGHVESQFDWTLLCNTVNLAVKDTFDVLFIVVDDANKCRLYKADTLTVKIIGQPPDNHPPLLTISSTNPDLPFINLEQELFVGDQISLGLIGVDNDISPQDNISIELFDIRGPTSPEGYVFEPAQGKGSVQTTFTWNPDCSIFQDGVYENEYVFRFRAVDDRCHNAKADTVDVKMVIRDIPAGYAEFIPPNFVSPDGDPKLANEFFAMVRLKDEVTGELEEILPLDNCVGRFVGITIYNRWGKTVFKSDRRDFRWYPDRDAPGVYFYTLTFSNKEYKGSVTVRN